MKTASLPILGASVCVLGLAVGMVFSAAGSRAPQVSLEPSVVELVEDPLEHQTVSLPFQLLNHTSTPIIVRGASASCNCMNVVTRGGQPLRSPLEVPPGKTLPWQVDLVTSGRNGPQEYRFTVDCLVNGQPRELSSRVLINIQSGWRADPPILQFQGAAALDDVSGEVAIFDGFGERGFRVGDVRVSNPNRLSARLEPVKESAVAKRLSIAGQQLPQRYRLMVTMKSGEPGELRQERVTLVAAEPNQPDLEVGVVCRTKPRDYELFPSTLVISPTDSESTARRTVQCRIHNRASPRLKVLRAPEHWTVDVKRVSDSLVEMEIVIGRAPSSGDPAEWVIAFGVEGSDEAVCALTVKPVSVGP